MTEQQIAGRKQDLAMDNVDIFFLFPADMYTTCSRGERGYAGHGSYWTNAVTQLI